MKEYFGKFSEILEVLIRLTIFSVIQKYIIHWLTFVDYILNWIEPMIHDLH